MSERLPPDIDELDHSAALTPEALACLSPDDEARNRQLADWLARIAMRDEAALGMLYDALLGRVYGLVRRIVRRPEVAEEVTEDVFFQVWRQADRFDGRRGRPLGWILTIARSRALDRLRGSDANMPVAPASIEAGADLPGDATPCDLLEACEASGQVHAALAALDPLPRQILALAFFRGLTHEEIAVHLAMPLGTVKSHVRRALSNLQRKLAGHAADPRILS